MNVCRKCLIWLQFACCEKCGSDYWRKTDQEKLCEVCSQQSLDEIFNLMEKSGLAHKIEDLKRLIPTKP